MRSTTRYLLLKSLRVLLFPAVYLFVLAVFAIVTGGFFILGHGVILPALILSLICLAMGFTVWWYHFRLFKMLRETEVPANAGLRLFPWFVPMFYVLSLVFATYCLAPRFDWAPMILLFGVPWNWVLIFIVGDIPMVIGLLMFFPLVAASIKIIVGVCVEARKTPFSEWGRSLARLAACVVVLLAAIHLAHQNFRRHILANDRTVDKIRDEKVYWRWMRDERVPGRYFLQTSKQIDATDLSPYTPFSTGNELVKVESPALFIVANHPVLHGAFSLYPVYAAAVEAVYRNVAHAPIEGGTSPEAFAALLDGKADIIFMLAPSDKQLAEATERGVELTVTPIGYEAFVFFVSRANPVDNLTDAQIRGIYSRKITRWRSVGGNWRRILPFQRPEGSGSQTAMERVMDSVPLAKPVREEFQASMGGIVNRVADYRNYGNAIGYSFRYYVESMFKHDGVKIISVNGVAPTLENIQSGAYPFVYPLVAMTAGTQKPNAQKLLDWFLSPQGQDLIRRVGYVPLG